jgi:hypothetical protein
MFYIRFIYMSLLVSICRDHNQVVYEYMPIVIELLIKMGPFLTTFTNNILTLIQIT